MGIRDAFLSADLLAQALHEALAGSGPIDVALSRYERRRDTLTANGFDLTLRVAGLAPLSPRQEALYRVAADRPDVADHLFGVLGGSVPVADLYTGVPLEDP
jgi:2-polyprenyl-6-methoxyphenol hydroxylase-like FAD-dependent oxidoreductase